MFRFALRVIGWPLRVLVFILSVLGFLIGGALVTYLVLYFWGFPMK